MEEYKFGGNKYKAFLGRFLLNIAQLVKWTALHAITRLNKLTRWLSGTGTHLLHESQNNVISDVKITLVNRHIKSFKFRVNGKPRYCYEFGTYLELYKVHKKDELLVTEQDMFYIRHAEWHKD